MYALEVRLERFSDMGDKLGINNNLPFWRKDITRIFNDAVSKTVIKIGKGDTGDDIIRMRLALLCKDLFDILGRIIDNHKTGITDAAKVCNEFCVRLDGDEFRVQPHLLEQEKQAKALLF